MPETKISFSEYAKAFYEIIECRKSNKAEFVKDLLKMGLSNNGKQIIDAMFPKVITSKGSHSIEKNKADQLRKYLRGDNGISDIAYELEADFDKELYSEELQDYEDSKLIEFAQRLHLGTYTDDVDEISEAIADCYYSIIEKSSTKSVVEKDKSNGSKDIILSYTIMESEKKALINICELIKKALGDLKHKTDTIDKKQSELKKLTDSKEDEKWKTHLEYEITSLKKRFDESYPELEKLCADAVELLEPKKCIHKSFDTIISIANNISCDEYKITCPDKFNYRAFLYMISSFNESYKRILRDINRL